jgi:flavin-dependent dehydrogenase
MTAGYDVIIAGGGLAGLCLARQLHLEAPGRSVLVVEKRRHPAPEAAFKVGESSVEIAAHYFSKILRLDGHLQAAQLPKLGLRYFFPAGGNRDIAQRFELGPPAFPVTPSFQLDRGRFENYLLDLNRQSGIDVIDGAVVSGIELDGARGHRITVKAPDDERAFSCRWIVDASGRAGLIRRKLKLARPVGHDVNAVWFRIGTRLKVDDWSRDPEWQARVPGGQRWLSTVHLMGRGYWAWLIPLGSGSTSVGIVADERLHPYDTLNSFERAMAWLDTHEPQCADAVRAQADKLEDFLGYRKFAYGVEQVFSADRWALSGEAGVFTDPFYSPGSDFIGMGNDFITELILRDFADEDITSTAERFNATYLRLFDAFLRLYEGQYPIMGNAQVMTAKVAWDNACYWAISALLFFQRRYRSPEFMASIEPLMRRFVVLHARMQSLLREWDGAADAQPRPGAANVVDVDFLRRLQTELSGPRLDDQELRRRLESNFELLEAFARTWQTAAARLDPNLARFVSPEGPLVDDPTVDRLHVQRLHVARSTRLRAPRFGVGRR